MEGFNIRKISFEKYIPTYITSSNCVGIHGNLENEFVTFRGCVSYSRKYVDKKRKRK